MPQAGNKLCAFSIGTPHADTGVCEIRELISSGKMFAVLTPISLIPQIARGCKEEDDVDEAIAEKVNQMTKIVMASTADAWLIHIPGLMRRHEVFTAEQLAQHSLNLEDLVIYLQDRRCFGSWYELSFPWLMELVGFLHLCTMRATAAVSLFAETLIALHSATCSGRFWRSVLTLLGNDTS
jgi:hypothetical protein